MDIICYFGLNREDAENFGNEGRPVLREMFCVLRKHPEEERKFTRTHRLDYESAVMREEKETPTATRTLACLKDLVPIELGVERLCKNLERELGGLVDLLAKPIFAHDYSYFPVYFDCIVKLSTLLRITHYPLLLCATDIGKCHRTAIFKEIILVNYRFRVP